VAGPVPKPSAPAVRDEVEAVDEPELLALGAIRVPGVREAGFRVFTDPVGHPFCIVFGHPEADGAGACSAGAGA
jgi:hypothetical protein